MSWVEIFQEVVSEKTFYRNLAHRLQWPVARRASNFPLKVELLKELSSSSQGDPSDKKYFWTRIKYTVKI